MTTGDGTRPTSSSSIHRFFRSATDRYAVRSDELGTRLAFERVDGAGTVKLKLDPTAGSPRATDLHATLIGRDGSAVGARRRRSGRDRSCRRISRSAPSRCRLTTPRAGPSGASSSRTTAAGPTTNGTSVAKGAHSRDRPDRQAHAGNRAWRTRQRPFPPAMTLPLQPRLYTGDGLLINTCFRGSPTTPGGHDGQGADIKLRGRTPRPRLWPSRARASPEAPSARPRSECPSLSSPAYSSSTSISIPARSRAYCTHRRP